MFDKLNTLREEREEGFTLVELLVVILIIGILAAIAIPAFLNQRKSANDGATQSDVKNASTQVETWITKQGSTIKDITPTEIGSMNIKTSEGVTLDIKGTSGEYCITGIHENGETASAVNGGIIYSSANGGIVTGEGGCNADGTFLPANEGASEEIPVAGTLGINQSHNLTTFALAKQEIQSNGENSYWAAGSETIPFTASLKNVDNDTTELTIEFPNGYSAAEGLTLSASGSAAETDHSSYENFKGYGSATFSEIAPGTYTINFDGGDLGNANEVTLDIIASNGQPQNTSSGFWQTPNPDYVGFKGSATIYLG